MDTIVFDIETSNFFTDPDVGWDNFGALKISVVGVYSHGRNEYKAFAEHEVEELGTWMRGAERIVGFGINRYDVPVLTHYFQRREACRDIDLWQKERVDLLSEIEAVMGQRISLSKLAEANLGIAKDHHGSEAISMFRDGKIEELKEYCLNDVRLTKELYTMWKDGTLVVPEKESGELIPVGLNVQNGKQFEHRRTLF